MNYVFFSEEHKLFRESLRDFLAKEVESRKELLQALVKDKNDTPV